MNDFNIDEIQRNIARRLANESRMDRTIEVMSIIQSLVSPNGKVPKEAVLVEASLHGLSENDVEIVLEDQVRSRMLKIEDGQIIF